MLLNASVWFQVISGSGIFFFTEISRLFASNYAKAKKPTKRQTFQLKHHAEEFQMEGRSMAANFCHPTNHTSKDL